MNYLDKTKEDIELIERINSKAESIAQLLKIMAHPQRLMILCFLSDKQCTVGELQKLCNISQSAVSQFLSRMKNENLVECHRTGSFIFYSIKDKKVVQLIHALHKICCEIPSDSEEASDSEKVTVHS